MIFRNISKIVIGHYRILWGEIGYNKIVSGGILLAVFLAAPISIGYVLQLGIPVSNGFVSATASVVAVLTGFSLNTLVLLMRYDDEGGHVYEQKTVEMTKQFTLYTILAGVVLLISLLAGYLVTQEAISGLVLSITSVIIYSSIVHYLVTLLVIIHRMYGVIEHDLI